MSAIHNGTGSNEGLALDLNRGGRKKKRILIVRRSDSVSSSQTSPLIGRGGGISNPSIGPNASVASLRMGKSPSKRRGVTLAKQVNVEKLRDMGPTSPVRIDKEAGFQVDPKTKRVIERTILGTVEDFEEMQGASKGQRKFQPVRRQSVGEDKAKAANEMPRMQSITDSSFVDNQAEDDMFMYKHRLMDPTERANRVKRLDEARKEELEYEKEEDASMFMTDLIVSRREQNALRQWKKIQATWAKFKKQMSKTLKKHPDDLVISQINEYREKREEYEMLEGATPADLKHGSEYWQMSLRGMGTRYVPVGNIFSGLFCPVQEEKEYRVDIIRQPGTKDPKRTDPPKDWRHSNTLVEKHRTLKRKLMEMRPHFVGVEETEALVICSDGLFEWAEASSTAYFAKLEAGSGAVDEKRADDAGEPTQPDTEVAEEDVTGPNMTIYNPAVVAPEDSAETRLLLQASVGEQSDGNVIAENTGTTALFYSWKKVESTPSLDTSLVGGARGHGQVFCRDRTGVLLPGLTKEFPFSFKSNVAGIFTEKWELVTTPPLQSGMQTFVVVKGVVIEEDALYSKRDALEAKLADQALTHGISDMLRDIVRGVKTPPPPPPTEDEIKRKDFLDKNAGLPTPVYYKEDTYEEAWAIAQKIFLATVPPQEEVSVVVEDERSSDSPIQGGAESTDFDLPTEKNGVTSNTKEESSATVEPEEGILAEPSEKSVDKDGGGEEDVPVAEPVPEIPQREWGGSIGELVTVLKDEVAPIDLGLAESLLFELQLIQQRFAVPPLETSSAIPCGKELFMNLALELPEISDRLLAEFGKEPRDKFRRPRSLKPGQTEDPNRPLAPLGGAWIKTDVDAETEGDEGVDNDPYRDALEKAVAEKMSEMVGSFVENAISHHQERMDEGRRLQNMEISQIQFPWKIIVDEEEEEEPVEDAEEEQDTAPKETKPVDPIMASLEGASVLYRADMDFEMEEESDNVWALADSKGNEKRLANIANNIKRLIASGVIVITVVGQLGNPGGSFKQSESLAQVTESISELVELPVQFFASIQEAQEIIDAEKEKRRVKLAKVAAKVAAQEEKRRLKEAKLAAKALRDGGSDDDEDDEDEEDEEEEDEEEEDEDNDDAPPCSIILLENVGFFPAEHADYMAKLPSDAEEEDVEERQAEIDEYCSSMSKLADVHVNDDIAHSSSSNVTQTCISPVSGLVLPGLNMQHELTAFSSFFESKSSGVTDKKVAVISGNRLDEEKVVLFRELLQRVDEIILAGSLGPVFERVRREWNSRNVPEDVIHAEVIAADPEDAPVDPDEEEDDEDDEAMEEEDGDEGEELQGPVFTMTDDEMRELPVARLLYAEAARRGVYIHLPSDYMIGDAEVDESEPGFDGEYDGEIVEFVVPLVNGTKEDGSPLEGRSAWGMPARGMSIVDIGPETQERFAEVLRNSKYILCTGAIGQVQYAEGQAGTTGVLDGLLGAVENGAKAIVANTKLAGFLKTVAGIEEEAVTLLSVCDTSILQHLMVGVLPGVQNLGRIKIEEVVENVEAEVEIEN